MPLLHEHCLAPYLYSNTRPGSSWLAANCLRTASFVGAWVLALPLPPPERLKHRTKEQTAASFDEQTAASFDEQTAASFEEQMHSSTACGCRT